MSLADRVRALSIRLLAGVAIAATASSLTGCSYTTNDPCAVASDTAPALDGAAHFAGTPGAFDAPVEGPDGSVSFAFNPHGGAWDADPGHVDLDLTVGSSRVGDRTYWVHIDDAPSAPGTYDLAAIGAKACYCPANAPVGDLSADGLYPGSATFGGPTYECSSPDGTPRDGVLPACETLAGTLTVASFAVDCARAGEINESGIQCAVAFDATVDVPIGAGNVYLHVHGAQADQMSHATCEQDHSFGPDLGIGYVPN
jgi:hypothetical protein